MHSRLVDENEPTRDPYIIIPDHTLKGAWDVMIMFFVLYSSVVVPFRVCFEADAVGTMWLIEVAVSLMFLADTILTFNTAFSDGQGWVMSRCAIARNYVFRGWFIVDAPSSVPYELIELLFESDTSNHTSLRALRVLRLLRLARLLRILKLFELLRRIEEHFEINVRGFRILQVVFVLIFFAHLLGCGRMAVVTFATPPDEPSWVDVAQHGEALDGPTWLRYQIAFHWALSALTGSEVGPIVSRVELYYSTFVLLVGACTMGYVIGELGTMLAALDKQNALVEEKLDAVKEYVRWRQLPKELSLAVKRYYSNFYQHRAVFDEQSILGNLNQELHAQVVNFILKKSVLRVPIFTRVGPDFQVSIFPCLKPLQFREGEVVFEKGAKSVGLLFLIRGELTVLSAQDSVTPIAVLCVRDEHWSRIEIENGAEARECPWPGCFGQAALLGTRRANTVVATENSEALIIDKNDMLHLFATDPRGQPRASIQPSCAHARACHTAVLRLTAARDAVSRSQRRLACARLCSMMGNRDLK